MCKFVDVYMHVCVYICAFIISYAFIGATAFILCSTITQMMNRLKVRVSFVIFRNVAQRSTTTNESAYKVRNFIIIIFHRFRSGIA